MSNSVTLPNWTPLYLSGMWLGGVSRVDAKNELLGVKGPPLVGEEVRKEEVGKVGS